MEQVACALCGSREEELVYSLPDWMLENKTVQARLVRCLRCGLIYQNPRPTPNEIDRFYPDNYSPYTASDDDGRKSWLLRKAVQVGLERRYRWATQMHPSGGRLLDVGCATGIVLDYIQRKPGWTVSGVDISNTAAEVARQKYGLEVFTGTLESAHFDDCTMDVVTLWDVLEHLFDPGGTLDEIRRILKPGGLLVIRVPNADSRDAAFFGPYWSGWEPPRHFYAFGKDQLAAMLAKHGFEVKRSSCRFGSYMTFALSIRFWMVGKGIKPDRRAKITRLIYHPITRLLTAPFFFLLSLDQRGSSMTVAAVKHD
jgi:SAM-dependent methyltransferase